MIELFWPRGGWSRAFEYVGHRLRRLPDTPERIARGIAVGVFTTFTPLYGLHFVIAALLARLFNGNIFAALLGTFFGNPLTYLPIAIVSLRSGRFLLGQTTPHHFDGSIGARFAGAWSDLWRNLKALFTDASADWQQLGAFYHDIFLPWLIGGIVPGILFGVVSYYLTVPLIRTYQARRRKLSRARLAKRLRKDEGRP